MRKPRVLLLLEVCKYSKQIPRECTFMFNLGCNALVQHKVLVAHPISIDNDCYEQKFNLPQGTGAPTWCHFFFAKHLSCGRMPNLHVSSIKGMYDNLVV